MERHAFALGRASRWLGTFAALVLLGTGPSGRAADCPSGTIKVGEKTTQVSADTVMVQPLCRRLTSTTNDAAVRARADFCKAQDLIGKDRAGLQSLDLAADASQFELFEQVSKDQKEALQRKAVDALLDQGLQAADKGVDAAKSLNPWNVNTAIDELAEKGFTDKRVIFALRRIAAAQGKPAKAAAYRAFVEVAKSAKEGWDTGRDIAAEPSTTQLRFLLGALKIAQDDPELGVAVTSAEFAESLAYLGYLSGEVRDQEQLTDQKLDELSQLVAQMKTHVAQSNNARSAWTLATGEPGAPSCAL